MRSARGFLPRLPSTLEEEARDVLRLGALFGKDRLFTLPCASHECFVVLPMFSVESGISNIDYRALGVCCREEATGVYRNVFRL